MWKLEKGKLIQRTDESRIKVQVRLDRDVLKKFEELAKENDSTVSYLIESGLEYILQNQIYRPDVHHNIRNRTEFNLSIDKRLYEKLKEMVKRTKIKRSDIIEDSIQYIQLDSIKKVDWRYRIE